ncbi:hypothetical protein My1_117 [Pectobacterium phage My1]|uniref:Uncharacterized protein n=1 Tax=Pectobacterium phage My1 TaxID=1204539 RepID=J9QPX8_9CAUD|nr:hypothetical protein My1_117 [Pectobacterium phage My1]AFQ22276.1 hypothetical protein My1_117 [Pectobacterium phage My1]
MIDAVLPIYALRQYEEMVKEGDYLVVVSRFDKYILDNPSLEGNFRQRRLKLAITPKGELPYKLYKLKKEFSTLSQIVLSKSKVFIDSSGKVFNRLKAKYYQIEVKRVLSGSRLFNGKYQCFVRGINTPFILHHIPKWVSVIKYKNSFVLFDVHEERPESPRLRIKI